MPLNLAAYSTGERVDPNYTVPRRASPLIYTWLPTGERVDPNYCPEESLSPPLHLAAYR